MKKVFVIFLLASCTLPGSYHGEDYIIDCKDFRDGEEFSFRTTNVKNIRAGQLGAPSSFEVKDENGKDRFLNSDMEAYLKCERRVENAKTSGI